MPPVTPDIRDIKPFVALPSAFPWLAVALVVTILLVVGLIFWWLRRRRSPIHRPQPAPLPADVVARQALDAMFATLGADESSLRRYFFGVSEILRAYIEARFGVNATDLTTRELHERLREHAELGGDQRHELFALLERADLIKFARAATSKEDCTDTHHRACFLVERTRRASVMSTIDRTSVTA